MARALFVVELGGGFGHVKRLLPLARALASAGNRVAFLVNNPQEVRGLLSGQTFALGRIPIEAPPDTPSLRGRVASSHADILARCGFSNVEYLRASVAAWDRTLDELLPDTIISEHSPLLNLTCFGSARRLLVVGHGFILPPPELREFPLLAGNESPFAESVLLERAKQACDQRGTAKLDSLPALYRGVGHAVTGLGVLDPYKMCRGEPAMGSLLLAETMPAEHGTSTELHFFAYLLGTSPVTLPLLKALISSARRGKVFVRSPSQIHRALVDGSNIEWVDDPQTGRHAMRSARVVVHHGSMGTAEEALAMGKVQLVAPLYLEHLCTARALADLGVAHVVRSFRDQSAVDAATHIALESEQLLARAQLVAAGSEHRADKSLQDRVLRRLAL